MSISIKSNKIYSVFILLLFFFLAIASGEDESEDEVADKLKTEKAIKVTSVQIYQDYDENEVSADNRYKDKVVEIKGTVINIRKDFSDNIVVTLNGLVDNEYEIVGVACTFSKSHNNETSGLSKGDKIVVRGLCKGKIMGPRISGCSLL